MNLLRSAIFALLLVAFCSVSFAQGKPKMNEQIDYPYKAAYSSHFKIGKPEYSKMILDMWKDWDDNKLDRHDYMADTVKLFFPDGNIADGKTAAMEDAVKYRNTFTTVTSIIHAWVPLKSLDTNDDVVCVWGQETDTYPDGKVEKKDLHEVWWINKDGKISRLRQWAAQFGEQ
ncbi:MAG: hypothetical protein ABJB11_17785 [Ferruginibacter sp.]